MNRRDRRRRGARRKAEAQQPVLATSQQLAALYSVTLDVLLAGLKKDGAVGLEVNWILNAGPEVVGPVLGFMVAAAANGYEREYGSRDAAIEFVERELAKVLAEIPDSER
jgi:hypothetical protein